MACGVSPNVAIAHPLVSPDTYINLPYHSIEFRKFLKYVLFFDDLYDKFQELDTDADHRLSEAEFVKGKCRACPSSSHFVDGWLFGL
jgi:hypothetical protein